MPLNGDQLVNVFLPWLHADKTICVMVTFDGKWFCLIHFWLSKGCFLAGDKRVVMSVYGNVSHRFACHLNAQSKFDQTFFRQTQRPPLVLSHEVHWLSRSLISCVLP